MTHRAATTTLPEEGEDAALTLLSHDIRAALSDVIGGLRLIDPEQVNPATRLQLDRMRAAGELLAQLLEQGLAVMLGEAEARGTANVQLPRLLRDVQVRWSARAREKGLTFVQLVESALPSVISTNRIALERILSNLLSNAIKYSDTGRIHMRVARDPDRGGLLFEVCDDGPGFSPDAMARLFQYAGRPDDAAKPGQGLGLHIAKELAVQAGGDITARNRTAGGATVTLALPAACLTVPARDEDAAGLPNLPDLSRSKVLLAEDSATNQLLISGMLQRLGAEVIIAADGIEAVNALDRESFDLALIDIEMPRLSGIEVIRALRAQSGPQGRIPVMAVTAYVLRANREAIYAAGADAILPKPLGTLEHFGRSIARVLARSAPQDGAAPLDAGEETPVMVRAHFDRLLEVTGRDGSPELLRRLLEDLRHVERQTVRALAETDWSELRAQTHVLIALAGAVGAQRLQHRAEALNTVAHRRDADALADGGAGLMALLDDLIHFVAGVQIEERGAA